MEKEKRYLMMCLLLLVGIMLVLNTNFVQAQNYYNNYNDVLLVCNNASADSMEICSYFITKRLSKSFNVSHVVNLTGVSTAETIDDAEYTKIKNQINATLQNCTGINYIVTTKGVPLRTSDKSVDSKLAVAFGSNSGYYNKKEVFSNSKYGGYLVTRLDGPSVQDAKNLIDNSDLANLTGLILINKYSTSYSDDYGCTDAYNSLVANGKSAELNNTLFVTNRRNLSSYWSWGSNSGSNANSSAWNLGFNPGAIGETAVSTSARTLASLWSDNQGQSLISDLIRMNITGVKGYVYEPYLPAIARPEILFERYTKGYNLADSYYMASWNRNWMDVVIGDPKTAIVKSSTAPAISLETLYNGERISNGTIINLTVQGTDFFDVESVWYTKNGANITLASPYDINTTNWTYGNYNVTVYSNDTGGNLGTTSYTFIVNLTNGTTPRYSRFNGNTTDFKILEERNNVSNVVLEKELAGKIEFFSSVNVSGADLDNNVTIDNNKIGINTANLPSLNISANLTLYNNPSANYPLKNLLVILRNGTHVCNATTTPSCTNFTGLSATTVIFNVSYFNNSNFSIGYAGQIGISDCNELQNMKNDLTASYYLMNDIDCSDTKYWNWNSTLGAYMGWEPVSNFIGNLDGNNHTIKGLYIYRPATDGVGLFISGNVIDLGLINLNFTGRDYVGGISSGISLINNSFTTGYLYGRNYIGGIGAYCTGDSAIYNSYSTLIINGSDSIGGIEGFSYQGGPIENSYFAGSINGISNIGGLVGQIYMFGSITINNSFSIGNISGSTNLGGLVGTGNHVFIDSFWYNITNNPPVCSTGDNTGCTPISNLSYFYNVSNAPIVNWSFGVWDDVNRGFGHPVLLWQNVTQVNVSNCGDIVEPVTYKLIANISGINGTCFNVYSNNATLNLSGYSITGNASGNGVYVNNTNNGIIHVNINNVITFLYRIFMQLSANNYNNIYSNANNLNFSVNGTGNSTIYVVMNDSSKAYYVLYDGVNCYDTPSNCTINSNANGKINVSVKLD